MPPGSAAFLGMQLLALLSALALLVCNAAAGLASRLAGGLALTTTAVLSAVAQVASLDGLDMFHGKNLHKVFAQMVAYFPDKVNRKEGKETGFFVVEKQKNRPKACFFGVPLVEISGIEPLTS